MLLHLVAPAPNDFPIATMSTFAVYVFCKSLESL